MRILVTGGTGFVGKHLMPKLQNPEHEIWSPNSHELDLLNPYSIGTIIEWKPDVILHMAVLAGGILANKLRPADFLQRNMDMTSNLFHAVKKSSCKRLYTLCSVCAYPKYCPAPFKEDDMWNGYPEETNAPYGVYKRMQLVLAQAYREQFGIGGASFIPVNMYGEYDHFGLTSSHVIPALIRKFDNAVVNNLPYVECWGTGEATREFLYAGDSAQAIVKAILTDFDCSQLINLGTGKDISIKELAFLVKKLTNFQGEIVFTGEVSDGQPKRLLDVSRSKDLLDWTAETSFKEGLKRTIEWYKINKRVILEQEGAS